MHKNIRSYTVRATGNTYHKIEIIEDTDKDRLQIGQIVSIVEGVCLSHGFRNYKDRAATARIDRTTPDSVDVLINLDHGTPTARA